MNLQFENETGVSQRHTSLRSCALAQSTMSLAGACAQMLPSATSGRLVHCCTFLSGRRQVHEWSCLLGVNEPKK
jgi:hypothetical protein